jgi:hypothetical protein
MRLVLLPILLAVALTGCGGGDGPSPPPSGPDTVYISPRFAEAVGTDLIPQLEDYDWTVEGTTDTYGGRWALAGSTIVVGVHSPLYERLAQPLVVPDTVDQDENGTRWYRPVVTVHRLVPALLSAEWTADFAGPTIRIEIYAPHGLAGVRLTSTSVYYQACLEDTPFPCDVMINGGVSGDPWADPSATGLQGWADLTGQWVGWPSSLPPDGYESGWSTVVNVNIADDQGHVGFGSCGGGSIPSDGRTLRCGVLFAK